MPHPEHVTHFTARAVALTVTVAGTSLALLATTGGTGAQAAAPAYVALGDSYSAGVGTWNRVDPTCYRSPKGYPVLIASSRGYALSYQACSGATTSEVKANQLAALGAGTAYVTLTAGGNDIGFAPVITECAKPGWMSNCTGAVNNAESILWNQLPSRLDGLYGSVLAKAPNARVVVVGYPRLFMGVDCNLFTFFSGDEMAKLNRAADDLATVTSSRAGAAGFGFVDVRGAFVGHAVCSSREWINGLSSPVDESFHPNVNGNIAYANLVSPTLTGSRTTTAVTAPPASTAPAAAPSTGPGLQMGRADGPSAQWYAAALPDLASPANLARAQAAGIDRATIRRLDRALRSNNLVLARAAWAELHALDKAFEVARARPSR